MKNIIVCIDNKCSINTIKKEEITIGKKYISLFSSLSSYYVINDKGEEMGYFKNRFISLKEYSKNKINNLITKILR